MSVIIKMHLYRSKLEKGKIMIVTFIGHRQIPIDLQPLAYSVLCDLIESKGADEFYVGHNGEYDIMIKNTLLQIKEKYPDIRVTVVLSYLPVNNVERVKSEDTLYSEILAKVPRKFAITQRNKWIIEKSQVVVFYVRHSVSNSSKFLDIAKKKGKEIINLAELV